MARVATIVNMRAGCLRAVTTVNALEVHRAATSGVSRIRLLIKAHLLPLTQLVELVSSSAL